MPSLMFQPSGSHPIACTVGAGPAVDLGRGGGRGAVGAVDDDAAGRSSGWSTVESRCASVVARPRRAGRGPGRCRRRSAGAPADAPLTTVRSIAASTASGSLCPPRLNSLMPLSGIGLWLAEIMTPRSASVSAGEVGQRGRRQDAGAQHLGAGAGQPGDDRGLEHLPAGAGVTADDRDGTRGPVAVGEHSGGGTRHREGQLRREVGVGQTPDAVGPEQATQRTCRSALGVLRRLAGLLEAVLLALLDPRVTGEEAGLLQGRTVVGLDLDEGAGDAPGAARRPDR